jgi:hypothetical protein
MCSRRTPLAGSAQPDDFLQILSFLILGPED